MTGKLLLDTNAVISIFANDPALRACLSSAAEVFISSIVLGELYYGARKSSRVAQNLQKITELAARSAVLGCDAATAQCYGEIKDSLRVKGRPIPENDIWIGLCLRLTSKVAPGFPPATAFASSLLHSWS
jgi:tRNA(fMet)-specific endonuclease VapC